MSRYPEASNIRRRSILAVTLASLAAAAIGGLPLDAHADAKAIKVGIISGEDEDVWRVVATEAAKRLLWT